MTSLMKTGALMAALTAVFMVAGQALGGSNGMVLALVMAIGMNFFSYWFSDKVVLKMSGAREATAAEEPELHQLVANLASRANLPMPRVYIIHKNTPNAFATGRDPAHAAVATTTGLMQILTKEELKGVMAHELAHIKNRDILISTIAATMAGAIASMASMAQWGMMFGRGRSNSNGGGMLGNIAMMMLAPLGASLIQMAISRSREYQADAIGAEICGHPRALASALQQLENLNQRRPMNVNPATAQMYIVNPLRGGRLAGLFSTHPPMQERIKRLTAM